MRGRLFAFYALEGAAAAVAMKALNLDPVAAVILVMVLARMMLWTAARTPPEGA